MNPNASRPAFLLLAILLSVGTSCAVSVQMQGNRFESSEVYGVTSPRFGGGIAGRTNIELTPDFTATAPSPTNPKITSTEGIWLGGALAIADRIEVGLNTDLVAHLKLQILGQPKIRAKAGNISLSLVGTLGFSEQQQSDLFSTKKASVDNSLVGGQLVAGYRLDRFVNLYGGPVAEHGSFSGSYQLENSGTASFSGDGVSLGGVMGVEIGGPRMHGIIEAAWNHVSVGMAKDGVGVVGAMLAGSFGGANAPYTSTTTPGSP